MIDWVALVWLASSLTLVVIATFGTWDALKKIRALDGATNGRKMIARMYLRNQAGRVVVGLGWTLIGISALLDERVTSLSMPVIILVAGNVIFSVNAALDLRTRRRLV